MKNKIAIASAFIAASSFSTAEIVVNDFLSFEGFVDMSYSLTDQESAGVNESDNSYGLDQVEISWLFDFDPVTAQIDLNYLGDRGTNALNGPDRSEVEQAFATYHMDDGSALTAGRFASMLGFEAFEPTGLYQYSFAYLAGEDAGSPFISDGGVLPGYDQGVKYTYESDNAFFGISLVDSADVGRLSGDDLSDFGIEVAGAFNFENGFSWFAGARYNDGDTGAFGFGGYEDQLVLNSYVTFETGAWIFAAELVYAEMEFGTVNGGDADALQALLMANFAYSDAASVTGRVSYYDVDQPLAANSEEDFMKYTLAHGYAFTDNLFLVNEISYVDGEATGAGNTDFEQLTLVAELIFSF